MIAEQAPDLHEVLEQAKQQGWSHLTLDGTLISIDRVDERNDDGHHRWYSGKHKTQGGNVQILADPSGFPIWSSEVEPGSTQRHHRRPQALPGCVVQVRGRRCADAGRQRLRRRRDRGLLAGQGPRSRHRQPKLQQAADRGAGHRRTRQCRAQRALAMFATNPTMPQTNQRHRRSSNRPIDPPTRNSLRKPQCRSERRCQGRGRGLPMMEVPTPAIRKTSTCTTLPVVRALSALT